MNGMALMLALGLLGAIVGLALLVGAIALGVRIGTRPQNKEK
jgi:hypothetical protein